MSSVDVYLARDQLKQARERAQQSLALRQEMGAAIGIAESQFELAEVAFEQGQLAEAETLLRTAPKLEEQNKSDFAIHTAALSARLLLAQSKSAESRAAAERARALSQQTADFNSHFAAGIASALITAAGGRTAEAMHGLESVHAAASRRGYAWWDFESRLHLGELELRSGSSAGRVRLQQLETEARNKGFLLIARKAGTALNN